MAIFDTSKKPSHSIMIGRNAIFGIGKPTEMIGSKNQRTGTLRAIAAPSSDAADRGDREADQRAVERQAEVDEQVAARARRPRCAANTADSGGSMNGVTCPQLREQLPGEPRARQWEGGPRRAASATRARIGRSSTRAIAAPVASAPGRARSAAKPSSATVSTTANMPS